MCRQSGASVNSRRGSGQARDGHDKRHLRRVGGSPAHGPIPQAARGRNSCATAGAAGAAASVLRNAGRGQVRISSSPGTSEAMAQPLMEPTEQPITRSGRHTGRRTSPDTCLVGSEHTSGG